MLLIHIPDMCFIIKTIGRLIVIKNLIMVAMSINISSRIFAITSRVLWCCAISSRFIIVACFAIVWGGATLVSADDTEIYLGNRDTLKHNVLFIFDTSNSMNRTVRIDDNNDGDTNDPGENRGTRLAILKQVMDTLIAGLDNLKVGYMRMNGGHPADQGGAPLVCNPLLIREGAQTHSTNVAQRRPDQSNACYVPIGGSVLFPVADLDMNISDIPGATQVISTNNGLSSGLSDAQQAVTSGSAIEFSANVLDIGAVGCAAGDIATASATPAFNDDDVSETVNNGSPSGVTNPLDSNAIALGRDLSAFRFHFVNGPPPNAPIIDARITFYAIASSSSDLDIPIYGVPGTSGIGRFASISGLTATSASVLWSNVPAVVAQRALTTPNLVGIVQELVNDASWTGGSDNMTFVFQNAGTGASSEPVRLVNNNQGGGVLNELSVRYCRQISNVATRQKVGVNFRDVGVPQGARIESAAIEFIAAAPSLNVTGAASSSITITADDVDNSGLFTATSDIQSRVNTSASVTWTAQQMGTPWTMGDVYSTPDLTSIVNEIVERSNWCGGNGISFILTGNDTDLLRRVQSYNAGASVAPHLRIEYSNIYDNNDTGCNRRRQAIPISSRNFNATASGGTNSVPAGLTGQAATLSLSSNRAVTGLIFKLPVPNNVVIDEAILRLTLSDSASLPLTVNLNVEDTVSPRTFARGRSQEFSTTRRPRMTGSGLPLVVNLPVANAGDVQRIDVTTLVAAVTSRADWDSDRRISFIFEAGSNQNQTYRVHSFSSSRSRSPRLELNFRENVASNTPRTVRDDLLRLNEKTFTSRNTLGWTPSIETLYEAALYWRGKAVHFGRRRGLATITHTGILDNLLVRRSAGGLPRMGSVDFSRSMSRTLTSHPASWTDGNYVSERLTLPGNECQFSHEPRCRRDLILGTPRYISPIRGVAAECTSNFQIFLTDGAPTLNNQSVIDLITAEFDDISSCSVDVAVNARGARGQCAVEMLQSLNNNDQSSVTGMQVVRTNTIAFNLTDANAVTWLQQLAAAGGGNFYSADDSAVLSDVLGTIFDNILNIPSAFTAPAISANAFNRLFSRDEIYFGLFQVDVTAQWDGNIKKYNICDRVDRDGDGNPDCTLGDVLGANGNVAVSGGRFKANSMSVWSSELDGGLLHVGGAGSEITRIIQRTIYTDLNSTGTPASGKLNVDGYRITSANWNSIADPDLTHIHAAVCPTPNDLSSSSDCEARMLWMLGQDVQDEDGDSDSTDLRWWFSDVLHSSPIVVSYGLDDKGTPADRDDEFIDHILVGTNDGGVHMFNGFSGLEEWTFIPSILMPNLQILYDNTQAQHVYGMDLTPVIWSLDVNNNGIIEPPDDKVYAYLGMRRGGGNYYALDITPSSTLTSVTSTIIPRLLWRIQGGSLSTQGNFSRLAQTWSEPVVANILCKINTGCPDGNKTVLIFGGGYDDRLDENSVFDIAPNDGNAIYIVDAETGNLIIWISHAAVAATTSRPAITASGADIEVPGMLYSIMSQITVFDSNLDGLDDRLYVGDSSGQVWRVDLGNDIIVGGTSSPEGGTVVGKLANISTAGSTSAERRFHYKPAVVQVIDSKYSNTARSEFDYVVIASGDRASPLNVDVRDRLYAFRDQNIGKMNGASGLAIGYPLGTTGNTAIAESNMVDVTTQVLDNGDANHLSSLGWYYSFDTAGAGTGQKGLSTPVIAAGNVLLTSYLPPDQNTVSVCNPSEGNGVAHNFNILNAAATLDWNGNSSIDLIADRSSTLGAGIPSGVIPIFTREGVTLSVGTGQGPENLGVVGDLPRYRSYWVDEVPSE